MWSSLSSRNPRFNVHHAYTTFFEGTLICKCGKLMKPDQDVMNRIKEAFEILKAPYYRTSQIVTRGSTCGPNPWQQHHRKARDSLRSATKGERAFRSIWDRWQNDEIYRKSQLAHKFAETQNSERPRPSSSSSWSPSPTWWSSSSWTQSWQKWHPQRWQDDKKSEQW